MGGVASGRGHAFTLLFGGVLVCVAAIWCVSVLLFGSRAQGSLFTLGAGLTLGGASLLAWQVVLRSIRQSDGDPGVAAWIGFPCTVLFACASLPFLVVSVYPDAAKSLVRDERVVATLRRSERGTTLEILFAQPVKTLGSNLVVDGHEDADGRVVNDRELFSWQSSRVLRIDLDAFGETVQLDSIVSVGINRAPQLRPFVYEDGTPVPPQNVPVKR